MIRQIGMLVSFALAIAAAAPASAQEGVTDKTIVIGQSAAFSGPAAQLGIQMRSGAKLWIDHVNALGGIHGRQIELRTRDDQYESKLAAENTRKFINEDRVFALFAYVGTPTSQASMPIFTEARVPFLGAFTGAELLRSPFNRYIFNVRASYYDETEAIVEHLTRIGARKIAVFHQADSYGQAGLDGTTRALTKRNLKVHALGTVERNTINVAEAVKAIHGSQPDVLILCHDPTRSHIHGFPDFPIPELRTAAARYLEAAQLTYPGARLGGVSLNTSMLDDAQRGRVLTETADRLRVPCFDPLQTPLKPVLDFFLRR